jgi:hypothetical protein
MDMIDLAHAIRSALESMPVKVAEVESLRDSMLVPAIPSSLTKAERYAMLEECSERHDVLAHAAKQGSELIAALEIAARQIGTPASWQGDYVAPAPSWRVLAGIEGNLKRAEKYLSTSH